MFRLKEEGEKLDEKLVNQWNKPAEWDAKLGRSFLKLDKLLLKPVKAPEAFFYSNNPRYPLRVNSPVDVDPRSDKTIKKVMNFANVPTSLRKIIPNFHGVRHVAGHPYIAMDNLMFGIKNPAVCDIKLGVREHDPFANSQKITDTEHRFSKRTTFGFRVVGMRTWRDETTLDKRPKTWGSKLEDWNRHVIGEFAAKFVEKMTERQKPKLLEKLEQIEKCWTKVGSKELLVFSSSLMILYESSNSLCHEKSEDVIHVKLIDFAHSFYRKDHPDVEDGVLQGIKNIRRAFLKVITGSTGDSINGPIIL